MPLYRALGNVQHSDLVIKKGDVVELPEGEKSDLLVLVSAPVKPAPVVEAEKEPDFSKQAVFVEEKPSKRK